MDTSHLTAAVGERFEVRLPAAASAGYQWQVAGLPAEVEAQGSVASPDLALRPGDPTEQVLRFVASRAGEFAIVLIYKRSWEDTIEATRTVLVTVR